MHSQKAREKRPYISFQLKFQFLLADVTTLAILRGIQGIGGAAMPPAGVSYLFFNFSVLTSDEL